MIFARQLLDAVEESLLRDLESIKILSENYSNFHLRLTLCKTKLIELPPSAVGCLGSLDCK
jgi:hypothetical protein